MSFPGPPKGNCHSEEGKNDLASLYDVPRSQIDKECQNGGACFAKVLLVNINVLRSLFSGIKSDHTQRIDIH